MRVRFGTVLVALVALATIASGVPSLTTIEDVLYKADGSVFNGVAFIEWKSFQASDSTTIATNSLTAPIVNGVLRVQLVPTTTATTTAYYSVRYFSDGRMQFEEKWAVPPSTTVLQLKNVRVTSSTTTTTPDTTTGDSSSSTLTQIQESDVVGLVADLAARPLKGAEYTPSRAAVINESGMIDAVLGSVTDCVRVDGTSGPCDITAGPVFVDAEIPVGTVDGSNAVFTLAQSPSPVASLVLYRNGVLQKADLDFTLYGNTITFQTASIPQSGDVLLASYRLADGSNPSNEAGGALTGMYPNPVLAEGVISNFNVSDVAGIVESKLTLNYPTHSTDNDPTADQKAALTGTSGTPSSTNKYVTSQDVRMSDARTPLGHALLGSQHSDATAGTPLRGDVIVGAGSSTVTWSRLTLGAANRCLTSNGTDAVWNTCLYTGFTAGSVAFVDANGNLTQNNTRLYWDNSNRRLSVANNSSSATLYVWDSQTATGVTGVVIRAGQAQGSTPLVQWLNSSGTELATVDGSGNFVGATFRGATTSTRAAWRDGGNAADPSARSDGDVWYNFSAEARKSVEAGQTHTAPQVLCSSTGSSISSATLTRLGSCTIPAGLLKAGDRVQIRFSYSHEGTTQGFTLETKWGATTILSRTGASSETYVAGHAEAGIHSGGAQWDVQSWGASLALAAGAGNATDSIESALVVDFLGNLASTASDTLTLRNFTVVRYPLQSNP